MSLENVKFVSPETKLNDMHKDKINIITQFYKSSNPLRLEELKENLKLLNINKYVDNIYLLNEKKMSKDDLGIESKKIIQINIRERLSYSKCFNFIEEQDIKGYIVICNCDIFFDSNLLNITKCNLHNSKKIFCLLRYEYNKKLSLKDCSLFGPRGDSQDTWIFHSNYNIEKKYRSLFDFNFGIPGCDNKIIYLLTILGYACYNEPQLIKCYHYHTSNYRNYQKNLTVPPPYCSIYPNLNSLNLNKIEDLTATNWSIENNKITKFIKEHKNENEIFKIPYLSVYDAILIYKYFTRPINEKTFKIFNSFVRTLKIIFTTKKDIDLYINKLCNIFEKTLIVFTPSPKFQVYNNEFNIALQFISSKFKLNYIYTMGLEIYNNIFNNPWTSQLYGKRILIINDNCELIKKQLEYKHEIYNKDLFPDCKFIFLDFNFKQNKNFIEQYEYLCNKIKNNIDKFDIVLCSCYGYSNLICEYIYNLNKSSICIDNNLFLLYFGICNSNFIKNKTDIIKLHKNTYWKVI